MANVGNGLDARYSFLQAAGAADGTHIPTT